MSQRERHQLQTELVDRLSINTKQKRASFYKQHTIPVRSSRFDFDDRTDNATAMEPNTALPVGGRTSPMLLQGIDRDSSSKQNDEEMQKAALEFQNYQSMLQHQID